MSILGNRIVQGREAKQWTQGQLAIYAGVDQSYLSMIESGKRPNVGSDYLKKIAHALVTTIDYLVGLTDDPRPLSLASSNPIPADVAEVAYRIQGFSRPVRERLVQMIISMMEVTEAVEEEMRRGEG